MTPLQSHRKITGHPSFRGKISSTYQTPLPFHTFSPTTKRELKTRGKMMPRTKTECLSIEEPPHY
ncbi:hypothetical protein OIU79_004726 [Salix purpurea]|uniref:Uncharacterized protein n=1 Tax=Salix purpurea TaxID=77065 RepID=A0A9Q0Z9P0_SALPP|nr:hypothetical protein OIU79_004726 [Salix purpurea]